MDPAELDRADALARAGQPEAASEYERVGDLRRDRDDGVGALVAYGAAIAFGTTHGLDVASKLRVEDKRTTVAQGFTDVEQVLAGAARALGTHPADAPGHTALCPGCGTPKSVVWLPCTECRTPHDPLSGAVGLLVSERVRSVEELEALGAAMRAGALHDVPLDLARVVDELLAPPLQGESPFAGERVPGTIATARDLSGKNAVILAVGTTTDQGASKPEFEALAERAARALLTSDDHPDELVDADGQSIREQRRALERRIGERIAFESWRRVSLSRAGCIGMASIPYAIAMRGSPTRVKLAGNRAAALVALEASDDTPWRPTPSSEDPLATRDAHDPTRALALFAFAGQLALHFALSRRLGRFEAAPYLSVTEAVAVMSTLAGTTLDLAVIECRERPFIDEHDPDTFPSEAAKRA